MLRTAPTVAARVELLERYPAVPDALSVALVAAAAVGEGDAATAAAAVGAWTDADPPPFASWSRVYSENDLYLLQDLLMVPPPLPPIPTREPHLRPTLTP
jgi:hypothetical protein